MIEAMKSTTPGNCKRLGELATADRAFEAGVLVGPIARPILAHHIEVGVAGNFLGRQCSLGFVHCRGGLGRAGMISARLLVESGVEPNAAIERVRAARPGAIETPQQEEWVRSGSPRSLTASS